MKSPCYNCPDRELGCHASCNKYNDWRLKYTAAAQAIKNYQCRPYNFENNQRILKLKMRGVLKF